MRDAQPEAPAWPPEDGSAKGCVVWFTGLPSSGKSTLAVAVARALRAHPEAPPVSLLDGDEVRGVLSPSPGYDDEGRMHFYRTLAGLAGLLARQGHVVLVPATAHLRAYRALGRELAPRFLEVHVATPPEVCAERDAKGLYRASAEGGVTTLPGAGAGYEPPLDADVTTDGTSDLEVDTTEGGEASGSIAVILTALGLA